jgi:hypothetical protein
MFAADDSERVKHMAEVEKICDLYDLDQLRDLNERLGGAGEGARNVFLSELERFAARLLEERAKVAELSRAGSGADGKASGHTRVS